MRPSLRTIIQYLLPHKFICWLAHISANCKFTCVKNYLIGYFIKRYAVNMQEAIETNPFAYLSYNDFFTRALQPSCRPIDPNPNAIVSPADGALAQFGIINNQQIIQAKGHDYSAQDLLGGDRATAEPFINGDFATIYLAPKDYHRVHMPFAGKLTKMLYVPGQLFSVNTHAAENIPNLFARNERVVCIFDTAFGSMAVVLVGAMIVGGIAIAWEGKISPPHSKKIKIWDYTQPNMPQIDLAKGAELGRFMLGSTVIVLTPPDVMQWHTSMRPGVAIKFGQRLGQFV